MDFVHARRKVVSALTLVAAACLLSATPAAFAAGDPKVWRALTEEDRRARTPTAVPGGKGSFAAPVSRDSVLVSVTAGIIVALFAGIGIAVLALTRRPRQVPAPPRPAKLETGSEIERLWSQHLTLKRRKRGRTF